MTYEYFSDLRIKIDLDRETISEKVSKHFLGLIDEVNEIETDCKKNEFKNEDVLAKIIENEEIKLSEFKKDLDVLKIDFNAWNDLKMESNNHVTKFKRKIKNLEMELFPDNDYTYEQLDFDEIFIKAKILRTSIKQRNYEKFGSFHLNTNQLRSSVKLKD